MTDKPDVNEKPFSLTGREGIGSTGLYLVVLGEKIKLDDDHVGSGHYLVERLNRRFAEWARKMEAHCNESADMILADMTRDSIAYCTGYHKGADVMLISAKKFVWDAFGRTEDPTDLAKLQKALLDALEMARKLMPAPNPDDEGFGRRHADDDHA